MSSAFTRALYYPHIDIANSGWLKTAVLFWDSISTIVPESVRQPYRQRDTEYLADIGFLQPIYVHSGDESVVGIEDDIINAIFTPSFLALFSNPQHMRSEGIFHEKMSYRLREILGNMREGIYAEKISKNLHYILRDFSDVFYHDGQYYFDDSFAYLYMVTLANKICENRSIALVTSDSQSEDFANLLRLDNQHPVIFDRDYRRVLRRLRDYHREKHYEQGVMLNLIIDGLRISPEAPLTDIIAFKEQHKDELRAFRIQLSELVQDIKPGPTLKATQETIRNIYDGEFLRDYNNLTKALESSRIKWVADNLIKISAVSASTTGIPMMLGATAPQALLAGAGISLLASVISYNVDKQQILQNNPYSYLLATVKEFR